MSNPRQTTGQRIDLDAGLPAFGLPGFRPGQREAIEVLLEHGRLLFVAPTGGGKSLIFQLPAVLLPGTTLVVCPLVSLMKDQVAALERKGIAATYLASTLSPDEQERRTEHLVEGLYKFLYVAPERLSSPRFRELASAFECPLVAVDESHCISEWGHDFRPEYLRIGEFLDHVRPPRVLAVTATATPLVQDEIVERLGMGSDTPRIVRGFGRTNLSLYVRRIRNREERNRIVDESLERALGAKRAIGGGGGTGSAGTGGTGGKAGPPGGNGGTPGGNAGPSGGTFDGSAVVYAPTRRIAEEEAARLAATGRWRCLAYHAGLANEVRDAAQDAFCSGAIDVVVATNAFGMGIDRSDVRLVIHLGPPGSIESYYQEVGRGGRDGLEAVGILLLGREEIALRRQFVESARAGKPVAETSVAGTPFAGTSVAGTSVAGISVAGISVAETSVGTSVGDASAGPDRSVRSGAAVRVSADSGHGADFGTGSSPEVGAGDPLPSAPASLDPSERREALFHEFMSWAMGRRCRHEGILRYFGEEVTRLAPCGKCDVCARKVPPGGRRRRVWNAWIGRLCRSKRA